MFLHHVSAFQGLYFILGQIFDRIRYVMLPTVILYFVHINSSLFPPKSLSKPTSLNIGDCDTFSDFTQFLFTKLKVSYGMSCGHPFMYTHTSVLLFCFSLLSN